MSLSLQAHTVGDIAVMVCNGRIVEGSAATSLYQEVRELLPAHHFVVLDLRDVTFIDSAGLGMLVRLLSRVRAAAGDLKLCGAASNVEQALTVTRLKAVLGSYPTEADAVAAFYQAASANDLPIRGAVDVVCIHSSGNVLAYLRELLRQAGYGILTSDNVSDALTLIRATEPKTVVLEASLRDRMTGGMPEIFRQYTQGLAVVDVPASFATDDAGEAGARLVAELKGRSAS